MPLHDGEGMNEDQERGLALLNKLRAHGGELQHRSVGHWLELLEIMGREMRTATGVDDVIKQAVEPT